MAISIVQSKSATATTGAVLTINFGTATTAGNTLVACIITGSTAITGLALGGTVGSWAKSTAATNTGIGQTSVWAYPGINSGQTAVSMTQAVSGTVAAWVYEVSGLGTSSILDVASSQTASTTLHAFNSGTTPTTTQVSEIAFGAVGGFTQDFSAYPTLAATGSWTTSAQLNWATAVYLFAGFQTVGTMGTQVFSGTDSNATDGGLAYCSVIATYKASTGSSNTGTGSMGMSAFGLTGAGSSNLGSATMGMPAFGMTGSGTQLITGSGSMGRPAMGMTGTGQVFGSIAMTRSPMGMTGTGTQLITGTGTMGMAAKGVTGSGFGGNVTGTGTMGLPAKGLLGSGFGGNVSGTATMGMSAFGMTGVSSYTFLPFKYVGDVPVLYLQYFDGVAATTLEAVPGSGYLLIAEPNNFYPLSIPPQDGRWISQTLNPSVSIPEFNAVPGLAVPGRIEIGYPGNINESFSLVEEMKAALPVGHMWYRTKSAYQTLGQRRRKRRSANP